MTWEKLVVACFAKQKGNALPHAIKVMIYASWQVHSTVQIINTEVQLFHKKIAIQNIEVRNVNSIIIISPRTWKD